MSFLDPSITEITETILRNPVDHVSVHKAMGAYDGVGTYESGLPAHYASQAYTPGSPDGNSTYDNGISTPPADEKMLLRAISLLSEQYDRDTLSDADNELLSSVWSAAFPQD